MKCMRLYGCATLVATAVIMWAAAIAPAAQSGVLGYYRFPAIHNDALVFTAEGDLWQVGLDGGVAQRLTTHPAEESRPAFSPDGRTIAFSAAYEGPTEVYTLPLDGGIPVRQTYDGANALVVGWTPGGEILYATSRFATLPNTQLARVHPTSGARFEGFLPFEVSVTNADLVMKDGKSLEHVRVVPDELLLPTAADLAAGRDPVLARAVALLGGTLDPAAAGKLFPVEWK